MLLGGQTSADGLEIWVLSFVHNAKMALMGFIAGLNGRKLYTSPNTCGSFIAFCFGHRNLVFLCYYAF